MQVLTRFKGRFIKKTIVSLILLVATASLITAFSANTSAYPNFIFKQNGAEKTFEQETMVSHKYVLYVVNNDVNKRVEMLKNGSADVAAICPDMFDEINGTSLGRYSICAIVDEKKLRLTVYYAVLNTQREPLNNTLVRQALAWATPYNTIFEEIYSNLLVQYYGVIPKGLLGYTEYGIIKYSYNLTKAQELIQKANIDPTKYNITIYYNIGNNPREQTAQLLATEWSKLGFNVTTEGLSWSILLDKTTHGDFDVWLVGWIPDYLDPDDYVGPMFYSGIKFSEVNVFTVESSAEISNYLKNAKVIDTEEAWVVVGEKGTGATIPELAGKGIIVVQYVPDWENTFTIEEAMEKGWGFSYINPAFYRNVTADALIIAGRTTPNLALRKPIYEAIYRISNYEEHFIWLGQYKRYFVFWNWTRGHYYHPTLAERYDLIFEYADAPTVDIGIADFKNNPRTYVIATFGWPDTFDPAKSYETFGWEIFHQIGSTLVTYWKEETEEVSPDLAVAWAWSENLTEIYFVIRGGVVAYDPWNDKTYPIDATDVLFEIWRLARSQLDPTWMITEYINVNKSKVLNENEFNELLSETPLIASWKGNSVEVHSLDELLSFFGYNGSTAGVVKLKLRYPYEPVLSILATPFTMIIPAEYMLGDNYEEAMNASNWGKNPSAWAAYVQPGEEDPIHKLLAEKPVSTGPFYVKEYVEDKYILLERNKYYWNATLKLNAFPEPFVDVETGETNATVVVGSSDSRGPCNPSHTIDVSAAMYVAYYLGHYSSEEIDMVMDWEIADYNSTNVIRIRPKTNIITFGGPYVNLITYYYHYEKKDENGEPILPVYIGFDAEGAYIYSKASGVKYRMENDYFQGKKVVDYATVILYYDEGEGRYVLLIMGLSGHSTRAAIKYLPNLTNYEAEAIILKLIDYEGDTKIDEIEIVETIP
ncbi:MAG: peptide transporter [Desulfurococcales archaeon ex4484_217_2]|nr:MAG: peptide transporter [Desulfurococcales archaeon ex4484_217_2]